MPGRTENSVRRAAAGRRKRCMEKLIVRGRKKLYGKIEIAAAKNSVLPLMAACVLRGGKTVIENCPRICDVIVMGRILRSLGATVSFGENSLVVNADGVCRYDLPCDLTRKIRASVFLAGALVGRFGRASVCRPGGCDIGKRPIDIHLSAMRELGVKVTEEEDYLFRDVTGRGGETILSFPSVGATEYLVLLSAARKGRTVIRNAAREPEIVDLARYLNAAGAKIFGAGTETITIEGTEKLYGGEMRFCPLYDRAEAGTFLLAGVACGGELSFSKGSLANLDEVFKIIGQNACKTDAKNDKIERVIFREDPIGFGKIVTAPYPGVPTDLQPQLAAASCYCRGETEVTDLVFPDRFGYAEELKKIHGGIRLAGNTLTVSGGGEHTGAKMTARDLRGGAALAIAALAAEGESEIAGAEHIDRGYERFENKLRLLGADVFRKGE